ncbi:MAG: glycosyltransferase family 2 protein [Eubacterium sp.]|nr:glycosyltransferase family 2 protein [Eubacterium sp.]
MQKVSAIILNYNSSKDCEKCISFLQKQDYEDFEIILVDNNSSDEKEEERLQSLCEKTDVGLIVNRENLGYAAGNNIGLREAVAKGARWCMIINPDVELRDSDYIRHMIERINDYDDVAIAASSVVMPDGQLQNPQKESTFFYDVLWPLQYLKKKEENSNWNVEKQETKYCEKISGCCLFLNSEFLKEINYLDEYTFLYCEEAIVCRQAIQRGKHVLYVHDCTAYHEHIAKEKSPAKGRMKIFLKSRRYFIRKYSGYNKVQIALALCSNKIEEWIWNLKG